MSSNKLSDTPLNKLIAIEEKILSHLPVQDFAVDSVNIIVSNVEELSEKLKRNAPATYAQKLNMQRSTIREQTNVYLDEANIERIDEDVLQKYIDRVQEKDLIPRRIEKIKEYIDPKFEKESLEYTEFHKEEAILQERMSLALQDPFSHLSSVFLERACQSNKILHLNFKNYLIDGLFAGAENISNVLFSGMNGAFLLYGINNCENLKVENATVPYTFYTGGLLHGMCSVKNIILDSITYSNLAPYAQDVEYVTGINLSGNVCNYAGNDESTAKKMIFSDCDVNCLLHAAGDSYEKAKGELVDVTLQKIKTHGKAGITCGLPRYDTRENIPKEYRLRPSIDYETLKPIEEYTGSEMILFERGILSYVGSSIEGMSRAGRTHPKKGRVTFRRKNCEPYEVRTDAQKKNVNKIIELAKQKNITCETFEEIKQEYEKLYAPNL